MLNGQYGEIKELEILNNYDTIFIEKVSERLFGVFFNFNDECSFYFYILII